MLDHGKLWLCPKALNQSPARSRPGIVTLSGQKQREQWQRRTGQQRSHLSSQCSWHAGETVMWTDCSDCTHKISLKSLKQMSDELRVLVAMHDF